MCRLFLKKKMCRLLTIAILAAQWCTTQTVLSSFPWFWFVICLYLLPLPSHHLHHQRFTPLFFSHANTHTHIRFPYMVVCDGFWWTPLVLNCLWLLQSYEIWGHFVGIGPLWKLFKINFPPCCFGLVSSLLYLWKLIIIVNDITCTGLWAVSLTALLMEMQPWKLCVILLLCFLELLEFLMLNLLKCIKW